jgi:hypothetical protein
MGGSSLPVVVELVPTFYSSVIGLCWISEAAINCWRQGQQPGQKQGHALHVQNPSDECPPFPGLCT